MYARRQTRPKPRTSQSKKFPAPVAGWVSNRALSDPRSIEGPGAAVLDNFFPKATGVSLRRGKARYATLVEEDKPVLSLFTYRNGPNEKLFAANENKIYDISNVMFPRPVEIANEQDDTIGDGLGNTFGWASTEGLDVGSGYTGGDWSVVQFATTGGIYLVGVNGQDTGFIYDGTDFWPNVKGGLWSIPLQSHAAAFVEGETVTGGTTGATATVHRDDNTALIVRDVTGGPFQAGESLTGSISGSAVADDAEVNAVPGMDFGDLTSADMSFVWSYKNRLWFTQKDTLTAWYLNVDSIGGEAKPFPLGGVFPNGGALMFGQRWSLESGGSGGLSDQNIFVTTQGEVAIYQGLSPDEAATWSLVGVYRVGTPLGKRAYIRGGGDLAIATTVGLVPLSKAISLDVTALNVATVSYKIADAWTEAVALRGEQNWQAMVWPEEKMAVIGLPDTIGASAPMVFVSNTETGAWARFTNWQALCLEVYKGNLYFGSPDGRVYQANAGGFDDEDSYTGAVVPLFDDLGTGAAGKIGKMARARVRAVTKVTDRVDMLSDFNIDLPPPPDATPIISSNQWGSAVWGTSQWGAATPSVINQDWRSVGGYGYSVAPCYQVTSGSLAPLDVELVDFELTFSTAEMVT
jgi:hypothetical protein